MIASSAPCDLYPRILGRAWNELAGAVRSAHMVGGEKRGRFRVRHGESFVARRLARWSRLPRADDDARVVLRVRADGDGERWERHFGADALTTAQWASDGCLVERFDCWELRFALRVIDGALVYEQCGARLCLGPVRVPVPLVCAPRVRAREESEGSDRVHVRVTVTLPCFGLLIAYDGHLAVEESAS